jgi:hypothetical protein
VHGQKILEALLGVLAEVEDTAMTNHKLRTLLAEVRERAARTAAHNSKLRTAYSARIVGETPLPVL